MKHVHVSALTGVTIMCYMVIIGFALRVSAAKLAEREGTAGQFGKGLSFIF